MAALQIRIKDAQRDLIDRGAKLRGEPMSEFVRRAACAEAEYLVQERSEFVLKKQKYAAFLEALNAPPKPNEVLNKLLHTQAPWE